MINEQFSWRCPECATPLVTSGQTMSCAQGHRFPIVNQIVRFVDTQGYASGFGMQWNRYRKTQLDSETGVPISRQRIERILGADLSTLNEKTLLEAGCGAGRFTELFLQAGANVFAADLSSAVEANRQNCGHYPNYAVCQADIRKLPVEAETFDVVVCIGVIQHTPNPEETVAALCRYVKPGGTLLIDHYSDEYPETVPRRAVRQVLLRLPSNRALQLSEALSKALWHLHAWTWRNRKVRGVGRARRWLLKASPLVDYHEAYPQLGEENLKAWAVLDTHDTLTDFFKHLRTPDQIAAALLQCGMGDIEVWRGGNGVEARARKPQ